MAILIGPPNCELSPDPPIRDTAGRRPRPPFQEHQARSRRGLRARAAAGALQRARDPDRERSVALVRSQDEQLSF